MLVAVLLGVGCTLGQNAFAKEINDSTTPLLWGIDDAAYNLEDINKLPWAEAVFREFGFELWIKHYKNWPTVKQNKEYIRRVDKWCGQLGIQWIANLESANWRSEFVDDKGRDWFNRSDGRHFFLFPDDMLAELAKAKHLKGLMYDEAEHMQSCNNRFAKVTQPFMYDYRGDKLEMAAHEFVKAISEVAQLHKKYQIPLFTEHVFPVMYHCFSAAGYTAVTKILKESWAPVYIACAMGSAIQYDTELWITPDLWGVNDYPGHSVDEYRSALLLAYHMGADCIYTENLAYEGFGKGKGKGSLIKLKDNGYTVTDYGEIAKWFIHEYVPSHPRNYNFRELQPRVVIIRKPDGCWGQGGTWYPDTLFGNPDWRPTDVTEAWVRLWHLLTRGVVPYKSLNWHGAGYEGRPLQFFCPLDGVIVFDHHVTEKHLKTAEVIFLTGLGVSEETLLAVEKCVVSGAMCIGLPHLLPKHVVKETGTCGVLKQGNGFWLATEDFLAPHVADRVEHILPPRDKILYRFGTTAVDFRPSFSSGDSNPLGQILINGKKVYQMLKKD